MVGRKMSANIATQGLEMLEAVVLDFVDTGARVTTTLDCRIGHNFEGIETRRVGRNTKLKTIFADLALRADAALVIAPEFDQILAGWSERLEKLGVRSLGSSSQAVELCGDKLATATHLMEHGIATPPTKIFHRRDHGRFPTIVKPRFGAGCEDTFRCRSRAESNLLPPRKDRVVQPEIPGTPASVSFIVHGSRIMPLRAGHQLITHVGESLARLRYDGGTFPLNKELTDRAIPLTRCALSTIPGLNGFVGVDVILGRESIDDVVIDINPRLTLSYTGLRRLCRTNLAAAILDADAPFHWSVRPVCFNSMGEQQSHAETEFCKF